MTLPTKEDLKAAIAEFGKITSPDDARPAFAKVWELAQVVSNEELIAQPAKWPAVIEELQRLTAQATAQQPMPPACESILAAIQALDLSTDDAEGISAAKQSVGNQILGAWDSLDKTQRKLLVKALSKKIPGSKAGDLSTELELRRGSLRAAAPRVRLEGLMVNDKGQPLSNTQNAIVMIAHLMADALRYDEFRQQVTIRWPEDPAERTLTDVDTTRLQATIQKMGMTSMAATSVRDAIELVARKRSSNAIEEWLLGLQWDGTRRLSLLMPKAFGTPADRYHIRAGRNMLMGMVARAIRAGCQLDEAIVLEGPQGSLKSSALRVIGGEWFKELTAHPGTKDFEQQLLGVWLGEFAELEALRRAEVTRIKQFITNREDHIRLPYARAFTDLPRRVVFCGSTNSSEWLLDSTGGRRFIPIQVKRVDLQWLRDNRNQLFAEAVHLFQAGREWWRYPKAETLAHQEDRMVEDPWTGPIAKYLYGRSEVITADVLGIVLGVKERDQTKALSTRVGITLSQLGCAKGVQRRIAGKHARPWAVPSRIASQPIRFDPCRDGAGVASSPDWDDDPPPAEPPPKPKANGNGAAHESVDHCAALAAALGVGPMTATLLTNGFFMSVQEVAAAKPEELVALNPSKWTADIVRDLQARAAAALARRPT